MAKRKLTASTPPPDDPGAKLIIARRASALSDRFAPVTAAVNRYLKHPSRVGANGVCQIGNRPWVAPSNYMITLYGGIDRTRQLEYCKRFQINIPELYAEFLEELNGAFIFGLDLFGIPATMLAGGTLDRSILQCHDLSRAVLSWSREYDVDHSLFHFGGRDYSYDEIVGYFIDGAGKILCARKNGEILGKWTSVASFLRDEISASEAIEESNHPSEWK